MAFLERYPSLAYTGPFALFLLALALHPYNPLPDAVEYPVRILLLMGAVWFFSWDVVSFRVSRAGASILFGVAVFALWVAPDLLFAGYRSHWLFQNSLMGSLNSSLSDAAREDAWILGLRALRAVVVVPVIEEVFWRAWMMRWLISPDFRKVALGAFTAGSFSITAILFASEHGPYWDVGLVAGILYNWWMLRTKSLGDCILAHAVTNACLSAFVIVTGRWEYWL